jgi:hypothetical protein
MLILNAGKSHNSNDWFMWLTIENKRTKEGLRLEKRCWIKLAHHSVIWSYMELWTLDWCLVYCSGTLRYRPTTFMKSGRPKSSVFKFKAWPQKKKSESVLQSSSNTTQKFTHIWSSKKPNNVIFGGLNDTPIYNNFHEYHLLQFWC